MKPTNITTMATAKKETKKNIQETIIAVRSAMGVAVPKNGYNSFHKYKFAKASDVIAHCRQACDEHGLVILPVDVSELVFHKNDNLITGKVHYQLTAPDGSQLITTVLASGEDKGDKHTYKLMTGAMKYLLMQLFLLETDDDPEATEAGVPTKKQPVKKQAPAAPAKGKAPAVSKKPLMKVSQLEPALQRIDEEGEAYYLKLKQHFALTEEQGLAMLERVAYTKGMDKL